MEQVGEELAQATEQTREVLDAEAQRLKEGLDNEAQRISRNVKRSQKIPEDAGCRRHRSGRLDGMLAGGHGAWDIQERGRETTMMRCIDVQAINL